MPRPDGRRARLAYAPSARGYVSIALVSVWQLAWLLTATQALPTAHAGLHPSIFCVHVPVDLMHDSPDAHDVARHGPSSSIAASSNVNSPASCGSSTVA